MTSPSNDQQRSEPKATGLLSSASCDANGNGSSTDPQPEFSTDQDSSVPFRKLGHYEILERLGQGGMGDVYKAYERELDRYVAIKVLPLELARSDEFVQRFRAEATAVAKVAHPNVVQIYLIGEDVGYHFFAMEFVEGESLAELIHRKPRLAVDEALAIAEQTLAGLGAAHQRGIIHRDIKPANILLDHKHHRAVLADFGLVRSISSHHGMTATGVVMGTVDYISPEQGRGADIDARTDLYSMGVLLYEMLSGEIPFHADSPTAMIFQHVYEQPQALAEVAAGVPQSVCAVVHRLLEKAPSDRYETAEQTLDALRDAQRADGGSVAGRPSGPRTQVIHAPSFAPMARLPENLGDVVSPPWWAELQASIYAFLRRKSPELVRRLENTQQQVDGAILEYRDRHNELRRLVAEAEAVQSEIHSLIDNHRQAAVDAERRLGEAIDDGEAQDARDEIARCEIAEQELTAQLQEQSEEVETMRLRLAKVSATLQKLQSQRDLLNARLKVAHAKSQLGGRASSSLLQPRALLMVAATAVVGLATVFLVASLFRGTAANVVSGAASGTANAGQNSARPNASIGQTGELVVDLIGKVSCVAAVPSEVKYGQRGFAIGFADGTINVFRMDTGGKLNYRDIVTGHLKEVNTLAYSPDGEFFASGSDDRTVAIWEVMGGHNRSPLRRLQHEAPVTAIAFSPDGRQLLTGTEPIGVESTLNLWDMLTATKIKSFAYRGWVQSLDWTSEGDRVLIGTRVDGADSMCIWNLRDEIEEQRFSTNKKRSDVVAWSASGQEAYGLIRGEGFWAFDVSTGQTLREFAATLAAFSSRTNRVLTATRGALIVWRADNGSVIEQVSVPRVKSIRHVSLSDDGTFAMCIGDDNKLRIWKLKHATNPEGQLQSINAGAPVVSIACFPNGANVLTAGADDVSLWNLLGGTKNLDYGIKSDVTCVALTANGKSLLYGTGSLRAGTVGVRDLANTDFRDRLQFLGHEGPITSVADTPDGQHVVSGSKDRTVRVWSAQDASQSKRLDVAAAVNSLAVSESGATILIGCDDHVVRLWDWSGTGEVTEFHGHSNAVLSVAFLASDTQFVSAGEDAAICIWDASSDQATSQLTGHTGAVNSVSYEPTRMTLLSAGDDETVRLWDLKSGTTLESFLGHVGPVRAVRYLDASRAISGGDDGLLAVWELP